MAILKVNKFKLNDIVTTPNGTGRICGYEIDRIFDNRLREEIDEYKYKINMHDDPTKYLSYYERFLTIQRDLEKEIADAIKAAEAEKKALEEIEKNKEKAAKEALVQLTEKSDEIIEQLEEVIKEKAPKKKKA